MTTQLWREAIALDCSQVATPAQFWESYAAGIPLEQGERFGRNLDALRDALSARGPGFPGPAWLELHNVERLAQHDGGKFLAALKRIADELAQLDSAVQLHFVYRQATGPRGRLYQHTKLYSRQLCQLTIERAYRWAPRPNGCEIVWLKPRGELWQRLFIDAGFAVCEELSDEDAALQLDGAIELVAMPEFVGERAEVVRFHVPRGWIPELRFELSSGTVVRVFPEDPESHESAALFELISARAG